MKSLLALTRIIAISALAGITLAPLAAHSQTTITPDQARQLVRPFYDMLNRPATKDIPALANSVLATEWRSFAGETAFKVRDEFVAQVTGFGRLIPDLAWDIKQVLVDGNRIIVRSEASGTPVGNFMGVPPGGKTFRIMTIDIHTVENGKLVTAHHVEDWAGAIRQLSAK